MNSLIWGFILLTSAFIAPAIIPVSEAVEGVGPVLFLQSQEIPIEIYNPDSNTIFFNDFDLMHRQDGAVIVKKNNEKLVGLMFAVTGTLNGQDLIRFSDYWSWTWNVERHDFQTMGETRTKYYLTGNNNSANLPIDVNYGARYEANDPKQKYRVTNNTGGTITNAKFWFIQVLKPNDLVEFNRVQRFLQGEGQIHLKESDGVNLASKVLKINNKLIFDFEDLNTTGNFKVTDIYLGRADIIGKPNLVIAAVAVTKNNGVFPLGASVELDPTIFSTGNKFPNNFTNNFNVVNPQCMVSGLQPPRGCYADFDAETDNVDMNTYQLLSGVTAIPTDVNIVGIEVSVTAQTTGGLPCGDPEPIARLTVRLTGDANATFTVSKLNTWGCNEDLVTKTFGSSNDIWGKTWVREEFSDGNFASNIRFFQSVQSGGNFVNGVSHMTVAVFYTKKCVYPGSGDYDCNCTDYIPDQGTVNIGTTNLNVLNDDGNGILQVDDSIFAIDDIFIDRGCSVELIRGVGRLNTIS